MAVEIFNGSEWVSAPEPGPTFAVSRETHTYAIEGDADSSKVFVPFFVSMHPEETLQLVRVICIAGGGSATFSIQRNGTNIVGFSDKTINTTKRNTVPSPFSLAEGQDLKPNITAGLVTGWATITLVLERTSPVAEV